ncbi:hypothetical protein F4810DRAFT_682873 [Camillea tinctor]|nr:hypothetical protein F4810DRAFT_682873 [Camillea tinctor]
MNANGSLHTRVLRIVLRSDLPDIRLPISDIIYTSFNKEYNISTRHENGWVELSSFTMAKGVITAANAFAFFGPDLAANPRFLEAPLAYPEDLFFTAEILRFFWSPLYRLLAPILMRISCVQNHGRLYYSHSRGTPSPTEE